ncbi:MAG TPA: nuclear transport factor 2 family protein [Aldersonia sp.]
MSQLLDMLRTHYAGLAAGDMDLSTSVFDPEIETVTPNGPLHGIDEFRSFGQLFLDAVSDSKHEIRQTYEGSPDVVVGQFGRCSNGFDLVPG